jgi:hypothetical protein
MWVENFPSLLHLQYSLAYRFQRWASAVSPPLSPYIFYMSVYVFHFSKMLKMLFLTYKYILNYECLFAKKC